ncbi:MAG: peptidase T [Acidobacteriota bacterium]|jgi:tripeptide aminopeptidase
MEAHSSSDGNFALTSEEEQALLDRFLKYVKINTRSDENSTTIPSTERQWDLLDLLRDELREMGMQDVEVDEQYAYLYASLPANGEGGGRAPVIGFLAHVDTYPGTPADNVKPQVIRSYDGGDIPLPGNSNLVIRVEETPELKDLEGHTIVTTDGTTLLGADDKAGIAIIMTMLEWYLKHPEVPHGKIRIAFTPDEEIGTGSQHFDVPRFGAKAAYTVDGSHLGEIEAETFCADSATVTVTGADIHPGLAKGKLKNALRAASDLILRLPGNHLPETTEKRESYLHPYVINGEVGEVTVKFIVRAFSEEELVKREEDLKGVAASTMEAWPGVQVKVHFEKSYRNMKYVLEKYPKITDLAREAMRLSGIDPIDGYVRGGTDGSVLSYMGLPTPNLFDGALNYHGFKECISLQWMAKSCETVRRLVWLWGKETDVTG